MSSYSPPILGFDAYTPSTPAAHTVERPNGLLGMAFTPEAIAERQAEALLEQQMYERGGLRGFALADPEAFEAAYPNVRFFSPRS